MNNLIPNGFISVEGDCATLTFKRRLKHPIEAVWSAIIDPEQRADWFGATVIDGRVGGTIELSLRGRRCHESSGRSKDKFWFGIRRVCLSTNGINRWWKKVLSDTNSQRTGTLPF
jgi:hypothetical protein